MEIPDVTHFQQELLKTSWNVNENTQPQQIWIDFKNCLSNTTSQQLNNKKQHWISDNTLLKIEQR